MSKRDLRSAYHQAEWDGKVSSIFFLEILIIPILLGLYFKSWYVGFWSYLILLVIMPIKIITLLLCIIFTAMWGLVGWYIGYSIDGIHASILGALIALVIGFGIHVSAFMYLIDFMKPD